MLVQRKLFCNHLLLICYSISLLEEIFILRDKEIYLTPKSFTISFIHFKCNVIFSTSS